jgi:histone acetyltransferase 1
MHLEADEIDILKPELRGYVADALQVVRTKFVEDASKVDEAPSYPVEFAYQHFGDSEKIIGYKNLRITLTYADLTMHSHLKIEHDGLSTAVDTELEPDDIRKKVLKIYPIDQQECLIEKWSVFEEICQRQNEFEPFGEKIKEFSFGDRKFQLYKVTQYSKEFDSYFSRVQTLTMWFIESAQYIDTEDPRFVHYFLYEERENFKTNPLKLAGYMSLYRYYAYPDLERARFAHVLILPPYRNCGIGPKFLAALFEDIRSSDKIIDTTAEDPADAFIAMRDYVDCITCKPLPQFSPENLKKGFNKELAEQVQKSVKICKKQCRRIFEILCYYYVQTEHPEERPKFERLVKKRLELPFRQSNRDSTKIAKALNEEELAVVSSNNADREKQISNMFDMTISTYDLVINRLIKFEPSFRQ